MIAQTPLRFHRPTEPARPASCAASKGGNVGSVWNTPALTELSTRHSHGSEMSLGARPKHQGDQAIRTTTIHKSFQPDRVYRARSDEYVLTGGLFARKTHELAPSRRYEPVSSSWEKLDEAPYLTYFVFRTHLQCSWVISAASQVLRNAKSHQLSCI